MAITRRRLIASTPGLLSAPVAAQPAWIAAAPRLWRPDRIALKLDTSLAERDFLPLLETELQARFTAEVVVGKSHLPLDEHRRPNGQVVADTLLPAELRELGWTSPPRHVHLCLVGDDLVLGRWNFAFSASIGDLDRQIGLVVISLHRMMSPAPEARLPDGWPGLTAERVLRLARRAVAAGRIGDAEIIERGDVALRGGGEAARHQQVGHGGGFGRDGEAAFDRNEFHNLVPPVRAVPTPPSGSVFARLWSTNR
ncbi:hypothetical protein J4558_12990 [Leptolyngbya sp. 15MV]|nr:hypothetical protein J4558_12990 [Leptolyngbya sp. 15MV]